MEYDILPDILQVNLLTFYLYFKFYTLYISAQWVQIAKYGASLMNEATNCQISCLVLN